MSSFWRKHKRKILAVSALGAGAAAAYYWWYKSEEEEQQRRQQELLLQRYGNITGAGQLPRQQQPLAGAAAGAADSSNTNALDDSLQQHFTSIQELSDRQALEELLPRLHDVVMQATDYEPLREQLRSPAATQLSSEEKLNLWRGLASHSFTRALGAVWLVPLMDLLVRLKLHVVGRHMYLESKLPQLQPQGMFSPGGALGGALKGTGPYGRLGLPPCLSDRAKEEFFRCDYFTDTGAAGLLHKLRCSVERSLAGVDFGGSMSQQDVEALVITIHAAFEDSFVRAEDLWAAYLVPPGPAPVSIRTGTGVEALLSPTEATMVDELNAELRETLSDFRFVEALRGAVRHTSKSMGAYISSKMGGSSSGTPTSSQQQQEQAAQTGDKAPVRPFPYVVPIVAKSGQLLFDETGRCTKVCRSVVKFIS
eukprot:GHUV01037591.1.p1 GENE.GHUV01037591.1~~GHUV01037591.1.p1  ORF type:complete len:423 (+),score=131.41 GHUV01037591.1:598-1866(+)